MSHPSFCVELSTPSSLVHLSVFSDSVKTSHSVTDILWASLLGASPTLDSVCENCVIRGKIEEDRRVWVEFSMLLVPNPEIKVTSFLISMCYLCTYGHICIYIYIYTRKRFSHQQKFTIKCIIIHGYSVFLTIFLLHSLLIFNFH